MVPVILAFQVLGFTSCGMEAPPPVDFTTLSEEQQRLPENALASMTAAEGLEVQLFAAEPQLTNPTNMAIDSRGRIWICEANNYRLPYNPKFNGRPEGDRILILEDKDGDGHADETKVFYQGPEVNAALGIAVLGKRVIVSHSPNIYVFYDDDGDDRPDRRDTLFTGINGPDDDHGAHAVIFGPDGRYYFNFGNVGYQLKDKTGEPVPDQFGRPIRTQGDPYWQGMAFRFDPDSNFVEVLAHNFRNNFELTVDAFGTVWQTDNDDDGNRACRVNYVMEGGNFGYRDEMTGAGWQERRVGMHPEIPKRHWHLNDPGVVPNLLQTGAGSPAGIAFYSGDLLPETFRHQMIHCEALDGTVRAYPVVRQGAGYSATIRNLLESIDPWFRPSDVTVAPDGSVFVADWYDAGVGGNKMEDIQRGRIYRLAPPKTAYRMPKLDLERPAGAAAALLNPNMDVQYQAWTRLRQMGAAAEGALLDLWEGEDTPARARALWLLARIPGKTSSYIEAALRDPQPDIRILGLRVARQLDAGRLPAYVGQLVNDPDAAVRREAALALRAMDATEAAPLWAELAAGYDGSDRWYLEALGIASDRFPDRCFEAWLDKVGDDWKRPAGREIVWRIRARAAVALLTSMIADTTVSTVDLPRYFRAYHFKQSPEKDQLIASLVGSDHPLAGRINTYALGQISAAYVTQNAAFRKKVRSILPSIQGSPEWLTAIRNLQLKEQAPQLLEVFLESDDANLANESATLLFDFGGRPLIARHFAGLDDQAKKALLARLGRIQHPEAVAFLASLLADTGQPFPLQSQLVESLGNTWDGQHLLFDKLKKGELLGDLKNTAALKLMNCWDPEIRQAAPDYLTAARAKGGVLPPVHELVSMKGNVASGQEIFAQHCENCHQVNGKGTDFGPDLSAIGDKLAKEALFNSILYPSAGINYGYEGYVLRLNDGSLLNGIITSRTDEQVTLKMTGGISQSIDRNKVIQIEAMDQSLMTANLQAVMSARELVNLVEYLTTLRKAGTDAGE